MYFEANFVLVIQTPNGLLFQVLVAPSSRTESGGEQLRHPDLAFWSSSTYYVKLLRKV